MIDWLTLRIPYARLPYDMVERLQSHTDRIIRLTSTGEVVWETSAWESIRSDSHQITVRAGSDAFLIQGSPARCMSPDGTNIFGSDDVRTCATSMIIAATEAIEESFPLTLSLWKLSRMDVTYNYLLPTLADVRSALAYLRGVEGGRYRVSQQAGDTVYWSHRSHLRSGKAYAKGPHLRYLLRSKQQEITLSDRQLAFCDRILRLEMSLKSQFWRERSPLPWYAYTQNDIQALHAAFFDRMVGDMTVPESDLDILNRLEAVAETPGRAKSALRTWQLIKTLGHETARSSTTRATWYRHLRYLKAIGMGDCDLATGQIIPFRRRKLLVLDRPITSWADLDRAA